MNPLQPSGNLSESGAIPDNFSDIARTVFRSDLRASVKTIIDAEAMNGFRSLIHVRGTRVSLDINRVGSSVGAASIEYNRTTDRFELTLKDGMVLPYELERKLRAVVAQANTTIVNSTAPPPIPPVMTETSAAITDVLSRHEPAKFSRRSEGQSCGQLPLE